MKEKKFLRWYAIWSAVIVGCFILSCIAIRLFMPNQLRESSSNLRDAERYLGDANPQLQDFTYAMSPEGLVTVTAVDREDNNIYLTMEPTGEGSGTVEMEIYFNKTGEMVETILLRISKDGRILDMSTGNFSNYRISHFCITLMILAFAILLWKAYVKSRKELGFSYQSIFCVGLAIWLSIITILMIVGIVKKDYMINVYATIADAPMTFAFITFPVILIFAIALIVSNISLIRHERFRFTNVLASILAVSMVAGFAVLFLLGTIPIIGSSLQVNIWSSVFAILYTFYAIMECFLLGAMICGTQTAKNQPAFDKDYIVILGCLIRKDGTLYPLIRGRVDRAIRFYQDQLEATGKKAIFVPSGGQGKNEVISEAEAMKRYLMEQGFTEDQILLEDQSKNTRQNMEFSKKLIGEDAKAVFSTTNFHVFRSGIISRQVGFEADGMGCPTKWYFWPNAYVREVIGMLSYKWKSLVLLFIPTATFLVSFIFLFK